GQHNKHAEPYERQRSKYRNYAIAPKPLDPGLRPSFDMPTQAFIAFAQFLPIALVDFVVCDIKHHPSPAILMIQ
ncbi:MAG: hypothetical protein R3337_10930, partial [Gammaproteobacteria bacterium]|nr:hypothetical protein [Gammaproteobacteria bacterium]